MPETVIVASRLPMAIRIHRVDPDRPAGSAPPETTVIHGERHGDAVQGVGITRGVDAEVFHSWLAANPQHQGLVYDMSEDDLKTHSEAAHVYGFEPGMEPDADPAVAEEPGEYQHKPVA